MNVSRFLDHKCVANILAGEWNNLKEKAQQPHTTFIYRIEYEFCFNFLNI